MASIPFWHVNLHILSNTLNQFSRVSVQLCSSTASSPTSVLRHNLTRIARWRLSKPGADVFHLRFNGHTGQNAVRVQGEECIDAGVALHRTIQAGEEGAVDSVDVGEKSIQAVQARGFAAQESAHKMHRNDAIHYFRSGGEGHMHVRQRPHAPEYWTFARCKDQSHQGTQGGLGVRSLVCFVLRSLNVHINPVYRNECGK